MLKESIILYAQLLKKIYHDKTTVEIAKELTYPVIFLDVDTKFMIANTYHQKNGIKIITINSHFNEQSRNILCAHELGHAILGHPLKNNFKDKNLENEYFANLFAVSLLFDENDFNMKLKDMSNYVLQTILEKNINF